jgi:hypothetical protein
VQPTQRDVDAPGPVRVGQLVGPASGGDVDLDHHQVRPVVVQPQPLHVLVVDRDLVVGTQVAGERREPERREQRVLDRPEERRRGLGQRREDHRDAHADRR